MIEFFRRPMVGFGLVAMLLTPGAGQAVRAQTAPATGSPAPPAPRQPGTPDVVTRVAEKRVAVADLPAPRRFVTQHKTVIRGRPVSYTATAGETYITNLYGEPIASFFSFAYLRTDAAANRPVLFIFNGGPGSASIWLHMGVFGPKRLVLDNEVNPSNTPPFGVRDNPNSPLDVADLVFIDPVGTGFSQSVGAARNSDFYGVDADADSVARFIELWLTENRRWNSPKYLVGESYGSVRAAVLPRALMGGPFYTGVMRGITVDGIVLLGLALNIRAPEGSKPVGVDPTVGLGLPGQAATAWYHNRIDRRGRTAAQYHDEVKAFATTDYAEAVYRLDQGTLPEADKQAMAAKLAGYTGVPAELWLTGKLRLPNAVFLKRLLADQGLEAGNYDSRYTLPLAGSGGDPVADDPAMGRYVPGFVAAFHDMLGKDLKVAMPMPYNSITWEGLNGRWNYSRAGVPPTQGFAVDLATAMRRNPKLRVLAASGYYDMVTTAASAENQLQRGGLPADRVTIRNYESGHMLYLGDTAEAFANDVRALIATGTK